MGNGVPVTGMDAWINGRIRGTGTRASPEELVRYRMAWFQETLHFAMGQTFLPEKAVLVHPEEDR